MVKNEPIIVAQIMGKWLGGGVESSIMNYYRNIDKSKFQFHFICDADSINIPYNEINNLGGKVIIVPPYQKLFKYIKELKKVFRENNYKIVHSNINTLSVFPLYAAKRAGVPIRIAHSHSSIINDKREWKRNLIKNILRHFSKTFANRYFSCSDVAAISQFGDKIYKSGKVKIIKNAIDIDKFKYDKNVREEKRKELGIDNDAFVIGNVGRFVTTKNQTFVIDIFFEIKKKNSKAILMLIGQGPLEKKLREKVETLNLNKSVIFLGVREDISDLYQAMDVFIFPSLYEGLGMALIEAQTSGVPCVCSTRVPNMAKVTDIIKYVELEKSPKIWAKTCNKFANYERKDYSKMVSGYGYDINKESKNLENYYFEYVGDLYE